MIVTREDLERHGYASRRGGRRVRVLLLVAVLVVAFAGSRVAGHSDGSPGANAVVVDVGPAPEHVLGVSNLHGPVETTDRSGLVKVVRERLVFTDDERPWVRGHRDANYEAVVKVMGLLTVAGMRVGFFIDREIWDRAHGRGGES